MQENNVLKIAKKRKCDGRISQATRLSFKCKGHRETAADIQELKDSVPVRPSWEESMRERVSGNRKVIRKDSA